MNNQRVIKDIGILGLVSLLSCLGFLIFSLGTEGPGFPLDDAWIHQAFARNFAGSFSWSFQLGQPSGGSTGPLWGILLSVVYFLGLPVVWGTSIVGYLLLWACSVSGYQIGRQFFPENRGIPLIMGGLLALEWHLVWAALSGMETLLLIWLILLVFRWILSGRDDWWVPGLLVGISIWVRPDGITLAGPVLLVCLALRQPAGSTLKAGAIFLVSLILIAGPYFLFNQYVAGEIWPSTFYAKQAEYAVLRETALSARIFGLSKQILTGIGIVLLPGLGLEAVAIIQKKDWAKAGIFFWAAGYIGLYALRLPVVYQHGRYIMPAIPAFLLLGAAGTAGWIDLRSSISWKRVLSAVWAASAGIVLGAFWVMGGKSYALDVGVIESEMVDVALWINGNTPQDAVIGAHDIGGLGYFGEREIVDLAGLVTPDVIPFIRDEDQLAAYLDAREADYLVTFPGWYPELVRGLQLVYQGSGRYTALFGSDRMSVYRWD